jgi:hypothetical protein
MRTLNLSLIAITALTLGCGGGGATDPNPRQLWLALNGSELAEQLVPAQPVPF